MILAIQCLLTIYGCVMLFRSKGTGKDAISHPHFRYLGGFLLTLLPVSFATIMGFGIVWAITHQGLSDKEFEDSVRWPATGVEAVIAVTYVTIGHFWEKAIKSRAAREVKARQMPIS
jgi:hypothetical protein